jgi:tetratricopeptide (TPR) repeat protein
MVMNNNSVEIFEKYLKDEMSFEEKQTFERGLTQDAKLHEAFRQYQANRFNGSQAVESHATTFSHTANQQHETGSKKQMSIQNLSSKKWLRWVIGIAAVILFYNGLNNLLQKEEDRTQRVAEAYFSAHLLQLGQELSGGTEDPNQDGLAAYNQQDYAAAIAILNIVMAHNNGNLKTLELIGLSHLAVREYEEALHYFTKLTEQDQDNVSLGLFLQAMTLMQRNKMGDANQAQLLLEEVVETNAEGHEQAQEWLELF